MIMKVEDGWSQITEPWSVFNRFVFTSMFCVHMTCKASVLCYSHLDLSNKQYINMVAKHFECTLLVGICVTLESNSAVYLWYQIVCSPLSRQQPYNNLFLHKHLYQGFVNYSYELHHRVSTFQLACDTGFLNLHVIVVFCWIKVV